jgi:hypothetical protein
MRRTRMRRSSRSFERVKVKDFDGLLRFYMGSSLRRFYFLPKDEVRQCVALGLLQARNRLSQASANIGRALYHTARDLGWRRFYGKDGGWRREGCVTPQARSAKALSFVTSF